MKKHLLFLLLLVAGWLLSSCNGGQPIDSCQVKVNVDFPEYTQAYLKDASGKIIDTLQLNTGQIAFARRDIAKMPYVAFICLINQQDSTDRAEMPIVVEKGKVQVEIGKYITTVGTPLNTRMQEFLNDLQATSDATKSAGIRGDELNKTYSEFYRQQILSNRDNVVGRYIYQQYGFHLNQEDEKMVRAQLGN